MAADAFRELVTAYALEALDGEERAGFEAHLAAGCSGCAAELAGERGLLSALPRGLAAAPAGDGLREQILDLALAPTAPIDVAAYEWDEIVPGIKAHVLKEDAARGMRAVLIWAQPGSRHPQHRHLGDENILVLAGAIRDHRGTYGPGQICRSRAGSVHTEEAVSDEECFCYVTYYGALEMLDA
jgi:anti-sigma factor ChrR (cupin superfamily)